MAGRLIIISGPSCVGKTPLRKAIERHYPDLGESMQPVVLYNDRGPRPGERNDEDYHFRNREQIEKLRDQEHVVVMEVRGDLQALDLDELSNQLERGDVLYEGNPFVARVLLTDERLEQVDRLSVFVSPLSLKELRFLLAQEQADVPALVADVMRRKLLRRTKSQKRILSLPDLEDIESRCTSAYDELQFAHLFDHVIANHDGEDSENWEAYYYPLGDARRTMETTIALLRDGQADGTEHWPEGLFDEAG